MKRRWIVQWRAEGRELQRVVEAQSAFGAIGTVCALLWGRTDQVEAIVAFLED